VFDRIERLEFELEKTKEFAASLYFRMAKNEEFSYSEQKTYQQVQAYILHLQEALAAAKAQVGNRTNSQF